MQAANRLLTALKAGTPSIGLWQMLPGANISRILARSNPDWVLVDCEHGNIDDAAMHECVPAIAAVGVSPIVRLPDMQSWMVKRALDCGAHGIVVPLLRTPEEARLLVQAAKFPPLGRRGFGSSLSAERFATVTTLTTAPSPNSNSLVTTTTTAVIPEPSSTEYLSQANSSILTIVQIETREALEQIDAIAAVDGIDVLFVGPYDLGNSIGYPILNGVVPPELTEAIGRILVAAKAQGKKCGIYSGSAEQASKLREQGFDMISAGTDISMLMDGMKDAVLIGRGIAR